MEKKIEKLTKKMLATCVGENSGVVVGASLNIIQTCMTYGDPVFQRATAEALRGMAGVMLQAIGKPKH